MFKIYTDLCDEIPRILSFIPLDQIRDTYGTGSGSQGQHQGGICKINAEQRINSSPFETRDKHIPSRSSLLPFGTGVTFRRVPLRPRTEQ